MTWSPRITGPYAPEFRGDVIARLAEAFIGCSLHHRTLELARLVAGGDDDPDQIVSVKTNCATFVRGLFEAAGTYHKVLDAPYENGQAVADVRRIALAHGALETFRGQPLVRGTVLHYWSPPLNNNHVEVLLQDVSDELGWIAETCGGGRPDNAITRKRAYDVRRDPRPLAEVIDPVRLLANVHERDVG